MKKYLFITLFFPLLSLAQECTTVLLPSPANLYADSIVYCVNNTTCYDTCNGIISITVYGDNQPYFFEWFNNSTPWQGVSIQDTLCPGDYIVTITDVNGNLVDNSHINTIEGPPNFSIFTNALNNPTCFNYNDGYINLTINGATPFDPDGIGNSGDEYYTYLWEEGTSTKNRTALDSGIYILSITDANGCNRIDSFELFNPDEVHSTTITDTLSCIGMCDGEAIVIPSDGVIPYTFEWNNDNTQINDTANNLCYGVNFVVITDANGCLDTNEVFIENPDTLKLRNITIDSSCYQVCDGQLSVTIEGGESPYATEWSIAGNIFNTTDTITNNDLCPGDYQLIFIDANGCDSTVIIPLIERDSFTLSPLITPEVCHNTCTGRIEVSLLDEEYPPIQYIWPDLGLNSDSIFDLCSDTFELVVIDEESCSDTFELFVAPGDSMYFDTVAVTHNSCYGDNSGVISINFNGGMLPLDYDWSNSDSTSGINSLASGFYTVIVTDANGCSIDSSNIKVSQPDTFFVTPSSGGDVSCFGTSDGLIDVDIFGGVEPYFISWDHLIPDSTLIDTVPAGEYIYTIVDSNLCTLSDTLIIEEPDALVMSDSIINVLCKGESTGEIHITVTGGTPPYEYSLNGGAFQSQAYFDNLSAGSYSIIVKDANDCLLNSPLYNISEPLTVLSAGLTPPNLLCFGDTGTVVLTVSGGTPNYSFLWGNGETSQNLNGVVAGNYSLTIFDANDCELVETINVSSPDEIIVSEAITDLSCFEDGTGVIDISITGGATTYVLSWSNGETTSYINGLDADTYTLNLTDDNGCTDSYNYDVEQPDLLELTSIVSHVACFGESNGEIDISVTGGTSPYNFDWSNLSSNEDLQNVPVGFYDITVTDANSCLIPLTTIAVNDPTEITYTITLIDLVCNSIDEGEISISVSGGTPAYSYSIDGGATYQSSNNFYNLQSNNYDVVIQDASLCQKQETVTLNQPIGYSTSVIITDVEGCNGESTGVIDFTLSGNTPPYTYNWSNNESSSSIYNLTAGNYDVIVSDAYNCEMTYSYLVTEPNALNLQYNILLASCEEKNDGGITTVVTGGTLPYSYLWGNEETSSDLFNIEKGTYSLYLEDSKGCALPIEVIEVGFDGFNGCIEIPSGFTPNNDNIHDEWVIYGLNNFPDVIVKIYNRWGQELFSSSGYPMPWDGKYNGVDLPTATYYYVIELNESDKVFNGTVTIKR
jgi:gliding motility-associated-like protein